MMALSGCKKEQQPEEKPIIPDEENCWGIDLSAIDFSKDKVLEAQLDGKALALITKEYLGDAIGKQAVLVYPITSGGKWNTDSISVAAVTLVQKGATFAVPEECVSGGSLKYYPSENVYFYNDVREANRRAASKVFLKKNTDGSTSVKYVSTSTATLKLRPLTMSLDGYDYPLVKIAGQLWTAENIKASRYADGSPVPNAGNWSSYVSNWAKSLNTAAGTLYNAYALGFTTNVDSVIVSPIAPAGWRVPTGGPLGDWDKLANFLPDAKYALATSHNVSGLSIVPSGRMNPNGELQQPEEDDIILWSSTGDSSSNVKAYFVKFYYKVTEGELIRTTSTTNKRAGFGVRLVKNF